MGQVNWNDVLDQAAKGGGGAVPEGPYNVYVDAAEGKMTQDGSKAMVAVVFRVADGPYQNKPIYNNFVLTTDNPNALGFFVEHMKAFGIDQNTLAQLSPDELTAMQQLAQMLHHKYATITVGHRDWQGRTMTDVKSVKPYSGVQQPAVPQPVAPQQPGGIPPGPGIAPVAPQPVMPASGTGQPLPQQPQTFNNAAVPPQPVAPAPAPIPGGQDTQAGQPPAPPAPPF